MLVALHTGNNTNNALYAIGNGSNASRYSSNTSGGVRPQSLNTGSSSTGTQPSLDRCAPHRTLPVSDPSPALAINSAAPIATAVSGPSPPPAFSSATPFAGGAASTTAGAYSGSRTSLRSLYAGTPPPSQLAYYTMQRTSASDTPPGSVAVDPSRGSSSHFNRSPPSQLPTVPYETLSDSLAGLAENEEPLLPRLHASCGSSGVQLQQTAPTAIASGSVGVGVGATACSPVVASSSSSIRRVNSRSYQRGSGGSSNLASGSEGAREGA